MATLHSLDSVQHGEKTVAKGSKDTLDYSWGTVKGRNVLEENFTMSHCIHQTQGITS